MDARPWLLDLFCGAGGAAVGYARAGFRVLGVDIAPQPNFPFTFVQGDALAFVRRNGRHFDAIHASPPCQAYAAVTKWSGKHIAHPDLIQPTRTALRTIGVPWVIENVLEAPIRRDLILCGSQFRVPVRRHRAFEFRRPIPEVTAPPCDHSRPIVAFTHGSKSKRNEPAHRESAFARALGCGFMTAHEAREAIPPAYTEFIGRALLSTLNG